MRFPVLSCRSHCANVIVFVYKGRSAHHVQLLYACRLLPGAPAKDSNFFKISWMPYKSKRPVRSVGAEEIITALEVVEEGKMLNAELSKLLAISLPITIVVASNNLYASPSTQRHSADKSTRDDAGIIFF